MFEAWQLKDSLVVTLKVAVWVGQLFKNIKPLFNEIEGEVLLLKTQTCGKTSILQNCRLWFSIFVGFFSVLLVALFFSNVVFHMSIVKSYGKMKIHISLGSFVSEGSPCAQERNLLEIDHNFLL